MADCESVKKELEKYIKPIKKTILSGVFQTGKGGYGEGDLFMGVVVPDQRKVAKAFYRDISVGQTVELLKSPVHEHRLTALIIMTEKFSRLRDEGVKKSVYDAYIENIEYVNNWDLVDVSAPHISGPYLYDKPRGQIFSFARSGNLWKQRVAMLTTFYFIRKLDFQDAFKIADILIDHPHDLIHKAVGWMLREIGNRDRRAELDYLAPRYGKMPRTMLRYAIEKFEEPLRKNFLTGTYKG
ncbi:MAG TPA: DNA alkylation repair protein [Candidatus Wallbacteria bacterium]|nr:MAG: DNA alkylation repair enzyme [bacterium ADurb.Bin243]HPG60196.1 DNA alkylation repair protein [Candidatus Wallbacteria bacterium]